MANLTTVSSSEIETYRQCRLKHQLQYIERWRTDEEAEALSRGTLFHSVMESHYAEVMKVQKENARGWNTVVQSEDLFFAVRPHLYTQTDEGEQQTERQELVEWIYRGYVECYGIDGLWDIVGVEVPLNVPLAGSDEFLLAGTADLLVRDNSMAGDGVWIVDHKTCKDLPKKDFDLEDQTAIYAYLLGQQGYDVRGAIYNHCRTFKLKTRPMEMNERFKRQITVRTPRELETCAKEALELMEEAYNNHDRRQIAAFQHAGDVDAVYDAPRTPDGERCGWKCNLTEACITGRKYGPERTRQYLLDVGFTQKETKPGPTFNKVK